MKRLIVILCMAVVLGLGLNSCTVDAYPSGVYYSSGPYYYGHPWGWHGGYYHRHGGYHGYGHGGHHWR